MAEEVCMVYSVDDHFTTFVQLLLAAIALASLWFKRMNEVPRRKFQTWFLDVSKQAFGACYAHVLNMGVAAIIAGNVRGEYHLEDQCAWYAINYFIDVTIGLLLAIIFLRLLDYVANERDWVSLRHSGVYSGPEGIMHWTHQMFAWIAILTVVKVIILYFLWIASPVLAKIGGILFQPLQSNIRIELLFVMIVLPGIMNLVYFWITDTFLKAKKEHASAHEDVDGKDKALMEGEVEDDDEKMEGPYVFISSAEKSTSSKKMVVEDDDPRQQYQQQKQYQQPQVTTLAGETNKTEEPAGKGDGTLV